MISNSDFYDDLSSQGITFFTGVPDSLLKNICSYISDNVSPTNHVIAANEGGAISLAIGRYLATKELSLVYMQNSGEGNALNPLISLADKEVYKIPMLLLIGWRGKPGEKDEPQHVKQGKITLDLLKVLGIPYELLPKNKEDAKSILAKTINSIKQTSITHALIVEKDSFEPYTPKNKLLETYTLTREESLKKLILLLDNESVVVSTTGKTSRELFELRDKLGQNHSQDFLTVGGMGHSSQIALGIALSKPKKQVFCFDGDGSIIMHMGSLAIIGTQSPKNFRHIIFNNGSHESVGGQPTAGFKVSFTEIARACNYKLVLKAKTLEEIEKGFIKLKKHDGPTLLEILIKNGSRKDLGRPTNSPRDNKKEFMDKLVN